MIEERLEVRVRDAQQALETSICALPIHLSELGSKCARVPLEIEKADDTAEVDVKNFVLCAMQAQALTIDLTTKRMW
ncbi:uncharacterized protein PHALS_11684 [Plasmopara halstedii]|uniref:Uncharacterized protein n=1 Tax=Plasmopara halstedii TaxID=4781 RepID=A0A0P1AKC5_PLAHL|nr:uncharacterized protein PHALS_11684 [Plasmopara halstedii]CEG41333.1 hypothetical protein PHALS_11684 [Plasmopara halstedii]|eukprot:XP_024577702.1 hypothetical protein PHALS_11684 [Plasmopara halstedii]